MSGTGNEIKFSLRPYLTSDAVALKSFMSLGYGAALGVPGLYSDEQWNSFREEFSADRTIVAERGIKSVEVGYCGVKNYHIASRRAELVLFCWSNTDDKTIADSAALNATLDWIFNVLALNKVTISVLDNNRILSLLESVGFIAEGTRKQAAVVGTQVLDSTVMGLLSTARIR